MITRLNEELRLLYKCEAEYKLPAAPVIRQLVADSERPLPDVLPQPPEWRRFKWPESGEVDYRYYWQQQDRERIRYEDCQWLGEHL